MYISPLGDSSPVPASAAVLKQAELLQTAPFVFPFIERVKVPNLLSYTPSDSTCGYTVMSNITNTLCFLQFFRELVAHDKGTVQGHLQDFLLGPGLHVTARRNYIYQDAFSELAQGVGKDTC